MTVKKIIAGVVALVLCLSTLAGCGDDKEKTADGRITIKFMSNMPVKQDSPVEKWLEDKYNVNIETISVTSNYNEKLGAMLASGDVPDVFFVDEPETWMPIAKQGLLASYELETVEKAAPEFYKRTLEFNENMFKVCRSNGKYYAFPRWTGVEYNTCCVWRKDWLENVGITKVPETLEEYEEAFTRFANNDPDGNGKKDTYGFSTTGSGARRFFSEVFGAYGVQPGQWKVDENGKVSCDIVSDGAKQALETLNRWYEKGLIHPEFITDGTESINQKFNAEVIGVKFTVPHNFTPYTKSGQAFFDEWKQRNPNAKFELGKLPAGPNGDRGDWLWGPRTNYVCFGKDIVKKEGAMEIIMKMLGDAVFDEEVALKVAYGDKDVTYEISEEDGTLSFKDEYLSDANKRAEYGVGFFMPLNPLADFAAPEIHNKYTPAKLTEVLETMCKFDAYKCDLLRPVLPSATIYTAELDKLRLTSYSDFVTGKRSLDTWDDFVAEYNKSGGEVLLKEAQEYYDTNIKD